MSSATENHVHSIQKGAHLQFDCLECATPVPFSVLELGEERCEVNCSTCSHSYLFDDPATQRQLQKFEALCRQIQDSEEILGSTNVAIDVGPHQVKVPYKLLLTRLNSQLHLDMGDKQVTITFRMEPAQDYSRSV